uniref:RNase H type-1 domain-containing protein n=1 Tax=Quercus lobata TaxID=97700 RepID=A0A7N2QZ24_QUELO
MLSSSSPSNSEKFLKKIRNNKVRHFLWRAVKDSLLMNQNLKARHVPVDDTCDHYNDFPKTVLHAFSYVMRLGLFGYAIILDPETLDYGRRNRMRVHQPSLQLHEIGDQAKELVQEFLNMHKSDLPVRVRLPQSIEMVEALATRKVVVFAKELSLFDVIIEGDCLRVAQALAASGRCNTLFGQVIEETRQIGASLQQCQFLHVRREGNRLAHALTRRPISTANTDVWVEEPPPIQFSLISQ